MLKVEENWSIHFVWLIRTDGFGIRLAISFCFPFQKRSCFLLCCFISRSHFHHQEQLFTKIKTIARFSLAIQKHNSYFLVSKLPYMLLTATNLNLKLTWHHFFSAYNKQTVVFITEFDQSSSVTLCEHIKDLICET